MLELKTPFTEEEIEKLNVGDMLYITGDIFCGRDAVLPKLVAMCRDGSIKESGIDLHGGVIFHTAVSPAGVGPTSSNKLEIESSFETLSENGIKMHLGKGAIKKGTVQSLEKNNAVFAVIPPVTALLGEKTLEQSVIAFPEEGMEAFHKLKVDKYPVIIAAAHGRSIYDE